MWTGASKEIENRVAIVSRIHELQNNIQITDRILLSQRRFLISVPSSMFVVGLFYIKFLLFIECLSLWPFTWIWCRMGKKKKKKEKNIQKAILCCAFILVLHLRVAKAAHFYDHHRRPRFTVLTKSAISRQIKGNWRPTDTTTHIDTHKSRRRIQYANIQQHIKRKSKG